GSFDEALAEASAAGYAEADPTNDVDGHDAAYKLAILVSILEGRHFHPDNVRRTSLRGVSASEMTNAAARGARIRYLAVADFGERATKGRVGPEEVPAGSLEGQATGPTNVITLEADLAARLVWSGPGAGGDATASAILGDVIKEIGDLTERTDALLQSVAILRECTARTMDAIVSYGERISAPIVAAVLDHHGVKAEALSAEGLIITDDQFGHANPILDETK